MHIKKVITKEEIEAQNSWHKYFISIAQLVATRSTCIRAQRQVGAILISGRRIIATGYNGASSGCEHCVKLGCIRDKLNLTSGTNTEICRAIHAEQNVLIQCALFGQSTRNSTLYCTHEPCSICTKLLIQAQVKEIYFVNLYPDKMVSILGLEKYILKIQFDKTV